MIYVENGSIGGKPMRIGVIGTGNIGGILACGLAANGNTEVYVYNRTSSKANTLAARFANIHVLSSARDVAARCEVVFLCTKSLDGKAVLEEIGPELTCEQLLVPTISTWSLADVEMETKAGVAKVIPSVVQCQRTGTMLVEFGPNLPPLQRQQLLHLLATMSTPFVVREDQIRVASDLASCGPAFLACLLEQWAEAAAKSGKVKYAEAEHLLTSTLIGVANLLQSGMTLHDIVERVAVPGGVTETGIASLNRTSPSVFAGLHEATSRHTHGGAVMNFTVR